MKDIYNKLKKINYSPFSIFQIQLERIIIKRTILVPIAQSFLRKGKNVSLLFLMSMSIQNAEKTINILATSASGFSKIESQKCPCNKWTVARVDPQEGQGTPVTFLKIQSLGLLGWTIVLE